MLPKEIQKAVKKKKSDPKLNILLLQTSAAVLFLLAAVCIRFFGGELYTQLRVVYYTAVNDTTTVGEVTAPTSSAAESNTVSDTASQTNVVSSQTPVGTSSASTESTPVSTEESGLQPTGYVFDFAAVQANMQMSGSRGNTLIWPVVGTVTSPFGYRNDPFTGQRSMHGGIDIAAATGTKIGAAGDGVVTKVAENSSYGKYIMVKHNDNLTTLYAHCSAIDAKEGQTVVQGQQIARVGSTGRSTGPHVHFETRVGGKKIDPEWLLGERIKV